MAQNWDWTRNQPLVVKRGVSPIFVGVVLTFGGTGAVLWFGDRWFFTAGGKLPSITVFVFIVAGWLLSLVLHEFAHALVAYRSGDHTVATKGYLTLDPVKYANPFFTFLLPLLFLMIGGIPLPGAAVMIETHRLRSRVHDALVSAAGPAINIAFAAVLMGAFALTLPDQSVRVEHVAFWASVAFLAYVQVACAILNLLPVPGLDGWGILQPWMPPNVRTMGRNMAPFAIIGLFAFLYVDSVGHAFFTGCQWFLDWASISALDVELGYLFFKFWD